VHELGHFLAAKAFGVKCEKFYVGFDVPIKFGPIRLPSKLIHFQWGETEYGIGAIPLGGYVKMLGQDDDPRRAEEENKRIRIENPNATLEDPNRVQLDPRSFPAKSVGARMVIISAGVVMNLIFGVLMAAWAFGYGVPYEPAVVGEVNPGDPAWANGIQPGDKVVQVDSTQDMNMSFKDMFMSVLFHGLRDAEKPVRVAIQRNNQTINKELLGTTAHSDPARGIQLLMLGLRSAATTRISDKAKSTIGKQVLLGFDDGESIAPKLMAGDVVVGINGTQLPLSSHSEIPLEYSLNEMLHPRLHESVTLQVKRKEATVDVEWSPVPMRSFGIRFLPGAVAAVMPDSPAAGAKVEIGDKLVAFNGEPISDAVTLSLSVASLHGSKAMLTMMRADEIQYTFEWQVPEKFVVSMADGVLAPVGMELPGSGLVYSVSNVVGGIVPNTKAAESGLEVGDVITEVQFVGDADADKKYLEAVYSGGFKSLLEPTKVDLAHNMQYFHNLTQMFRTGMPVKIDYERAGKSSNANINIIADSKWFWPERGVSFSPLQSERKTTSVATALSMGFGEIGRRMGNVLEFLELLIKGRMPFKAVGGPGMIAVEATDAASKGISPLLMFLVMLSANLAIINFLPIPALDGGHMMFLTAEAIWGKPVDEALQMKLTMVGVLGLLCLMGAVIINDTINLTRMFGG
jgi:regulator of sigma E protease